MWRPTSLSWTVLVVTSLLILAACGGGTSPTADLSGNWAGVWASSIVSWGGLFALSISQSGSSFSGTAVVSGSPCFAAFELQGTVVINNFQASLISGGRVRATLAGTVSGNDMQGQYTVLPSGTPCDGDRGTFTASRQ